MPSCRCFHASFFVMMHSLSVSYTAKVAVTSSCSLATFRATKHTFLVAACTLQSEQMCRSTFVPSSTTGQVDLALECTPRDMRSKCRCTSAQSLEIAWMRVDLLVVVCILQAAPMFGLNLAPFFTTMRRDSAVPYAALQTLNSTPHQPPLGITSLAQAKETQSIGMHKTQMVHQVLSYPIAPFSVTISQPQWPPCLWCGTALLESTALRRAPFLEITLHQMISLAAPTNARKADLAHATTLRHLKNVICAQKASTVTQQD
mmetsp:Transcript_27727/g.74784  ORF Transcript_27727/g.74784 Transcript_27727/m.74784 type:complete len:260 (+) Transcript_27727:564-1343(+)